MVVRYIVVFAICTLSAVPLSGFGSRKGASSSQIFDDASSQIDAIEIREDAAVLRGELNVARKWIEQGKKNLADGDIRQAAVLAERLSSQIELILLLAEIDFELARAQRAETEVLELEKRLRLLKGRYDRLVLRFKMGAGRRIGEPITGSEQ